MNSLLSKCFFLIGVMLFGACSSSSKPAASPGKPCLVSTDCTSPLSCSYGTCHVTCMEAKDCPTGQDCIRAPIGNVCQLPAERPCTYRSDCTAPLVCALDRRCRTQCQTRLDCPTSTQACVTSAPDEVCAEPADVSKTTFVLVNAQSTPVPTASADAGRGTDAAGGSGSAGSAGAGGSGGGAGDASTTDGGSKDSPGATDASGDKGEVSDVGATDGMAADGANNGIF